MRPLHYYLLFICLLSKTAISQSWSIEARPTLNFPTTKVFDQTLRVGNGFELTGVHRLLPRIDLYASLTWKRFDTDEDFDEIDIEIVQKGVGLGAQWFLKNPDDHTSTFFLRSGISIASAISRSDNPIFEVNSRIAIGIDLGIGIKFKSAGQWHFLPELGYSNASYHHGSNQQFITLNQFTISIAARRDF